MGDDLSIAAAAAAIAARDLSPVELTQRCLAATDDGAVNAFQAVLADDALASARQAEDEIVAGRHRGPLHGIPVAVKDLIDTVGVPTTAGSLAWQRGPATRDAHVVDRLRRAGAVIVGKTHTHEFAYGSVTPQSRNPWDTTRVTGGSSGGSAAAVATGACMMGIGTDTAGSIRMPASLCATAGIKPTYGRVSSDGVLPLSWSLDHIGPLTRYVEDLALTLEAMAGHDPADITSADRPVPDLVADLDAGVDGTVLGLPRDHYFDHLQPAVEAAVLDAVRVLEEQGATIREIDLPHAEAYLGATNAILLAEASTFHRDNLADRADAYTDDVRALLDAGMEIRAVDYLQALRVRRRIQLGWRALFDDVDAVVAPTLPATAARADQATFTYPDGHEESIMTAYVRLSCPANLTGLPALSVPCGFDDEELPIGLQVIGRPFDEAGVLRIGHAYESATTWTHRRPPPATHDAPQGP